MQRIISFAEILLNHRGKRTVCANCCPLLRLWCALEISSAVRHQTGNQLLLYIYICICVYQSALFIIFYWSQEKIVANWQTTTTKGFFVNEDWLMLIKILTIDGLGNCGIYATPSLDGLIIAFILQTTTFQNDTQIKWTWFQRKLIPDFLIRSLSALVKKRIQTQSRSILRLIDYLISLSAAYMLQWIGSALVQIMSCRLVGAKPLFEPMLEYC